MSRYSSMPWIPPSRPRPLNLMPPNGAAAAVGLMSLMPTMPNCRASLIRVALGDVRRVEVGSQAVGGVVGRRDDLVLVVEGDDRGDRPEGLLAVDLHVAGDAGQHGRCEEAAARRGRLGQAAAAGQDHGALGRGVADLALHLVHGLVVDQRADVDAVGEAAAGLHHGDPADEHVEELIDARRGGRRCGSG